MKGFRSVLLVLFLFSGTSVWSQEKKDMIQRVLEVSGIETQMEAVPNLVEGVFAQQSRVFGNDKFAKVNEIILRSFSALNFLDYQIQELSANYDEQLCAAILNDYTSRFLREVTDAENKALEIISEEMIVSFDYSTMDSERDAIISELIDCTRSIEVSTTLSTGGIHSLIATMNLFLPRERKITTDQEDSITEQATRPLKSDEYLVHLKKRYALVYQGISNAYLKLYVGFYRSPEGRYLYDSYVAALKKAFVSCMRSAAGEMTKEFGLPDDKA